MTLLQVRMFVALVAGGVALLTFANPFDIVSARQVRPGNIEVTVALDGSGRPAAKDLLLQIENSPPVTASQVSLVPGSGTPSWLVLCLDRSGSIGLQALGELKNAVTKALAGSGSAELEFKVAVMAFGTRSNQLLGFSNQPTQIASAIERLKPDVGPSGKTKLHDAIAGALATLRAEQEGSKRLIVVSDGKDEGSTVSAARLVDLAQIAPAIPIDAISFGPLGAGESGSLSTVAGATGGRFVQANSAQELEQAIRTLLSNVAPKQLFTTAFTYTPSTDNRTAESASLLYAVEGLPVARKALALALAAPEGTATPAPPPEVPKTAEPLKTAEPPNTVEPRSNPVWNIVSIWAKAIPSVYAWLFGAILAALLLLLALRLRGRADRKTSDPGPEPPASSPQPPVTPPHPPPRRPGTMVGYAWPAPGPGYPTAILRGISGTARGKEIPIDKGSYRIGCDPGNDLVLVGDDFASGHHARLRFEANALYAEDLGSTNGSALNGNPFKSATRSLSPGDELRFGHTTFSVLAGDAGAMPARSGLEPRVD